MSFALQFGETSAPLYYYDTVNREIKKLFAFIEDFYFESAAAVAVHDRFLFCITYTVMLQRWSHFQMYEWKEKAELPSEWKLKTY